MVGQERAEIINRGSQELRGIESRSCGVALGAGEKERKKTQGKGPKRKALRD